MPGQNVPPEEHYLGLPMQIDFSRKVNRQKLRRPSLPDSGNSNQEQHTNTSTATTAPKPAPGVVPSQAPPAVPKPGGAAAKRRLNYQITMAQLEATRGATAAAAGHELGSGSLLGKSSQYAASVSATAATLQTMTLSAGAGAAKGEPPTKDKIRFPRRLTDATTGTNTTTSSTNTPPAAGAHPGIAPLSKSNNSNSGSTGSSGNNNNNTAGQGFANFNAVVVETKRSTNATGAAASTSPNMFDDAGFPNSGFGSSSSGKKEMGNFFDFGNGSENSGDTSSFGNTNLFDRDGFPVAVDSSVDPFAISSFGNDFPQDAYGSQTDAFASADGNNFFPASTKDTAKRKKGSGRRGSVGTTSITKSPPQVNKTKKKEDAKAEGEEKARKRK